MKEGKELSRPFMACLLTVTGIWACLQTGLYFNRSVYLPAAIWLSGAGLWLAGVSVWFRSRMFAARLIWGAAAGPAAIALLYVLRLGDTPLSMQATVDAALRWGWLTVLAAALAWTAGSPSGRLLLRAGWDLIGTVLAYTALAAVYGLIPLPYAVLRTADSGTAAFGARLGGLLQYPNTFGAVMAAFLVLQLLRLARLPQAAPLRGRLAASAQALPYGLCLLLSESRGAWLAAAAAWTAAVLSARGETRGRLITGTGWVLAGATVLYRRLAQAELAPAALPGLAELAAVWAAVLLAPLLSRTAADWPRRLWRGPKRPASAASPGAPVTLATPSTRVTPDTPMTSASPGTPGTSVPAVTPAPPGIPETPGASGTSGGMGSIRLFLRVLAAFILITGAASFPLGGTDAAPVVRMNYSTVNARLLMFADAFRLFRSAPWLGQGGETWREAYRSVQSSPYAGSVLHSGLLDMLVNLGLVGMTVWLSWLGWQGYQLAKNRSEWFLPYLVLVLHMAVDFDAVFGLFGLLLVWIMAQGKEGETDALLATSRLKSTGLRSRLRLRAVRFRFPLLRRSAGLVLAALLLLAGLSSWRLHTADQLYRAALASQDGTEAVTSLRRALELNPLSSAVRGSLAIRLPQPEAAQLLRAGLQFTPRSPELYSLLAAASASGGRLEAAGLWEAALQLDRFDRVKQTEALRSLAGLARRKQKLGLEAAAGQAAHAGLFLFENYMDLSKGANRTSGPWRNDRGFYLTLEAAEQADNLRQLYGSAAPRTAP